MKKILLILIAALAFTSCKEDRKTIEFKKIANLDLGNVSKENATLHATAVFMNFSDQEFNLKDLVLDFTVDGKDIGTIVAKSDKMIKPNSEFSVPIKYTYETRSFVEEGHDPSSTYAIQLLGSLNTKDTKNEELATNVKYASTYEYLTKKQIRLEKKESRKEERQRKRDERKNNKNN